MSATSPWVGKITLDSLQLGQALFRHQVARSEWTQAVGAPSRTQEAGGPAPPGHRNNQVHYYDDAGVVLLEHHASGAIAEVTFVLDLEDAVHRPATAYAGVLLVGEAEARAGSAEGELLGASGIDFQRFLAGRWSASRPGGLHLSLEYVGRRSPRGKRSKHRTLRSVSVGLRPAP